ncbi:hypothetical protein Q1695_008185 [Nippostrongylus brasiliensis]|nr:hypothetical protein Q1695_008185 [Nippostrongylus brasiliensis]
MTDVKPKVLCTFCGKAYHPNSLLAHQRNVHETSFSDVGTLSAKNVVECPQCSEKFGNHIEFVEHCSYVHGDGEWNGTNQDYTIVEQHFENKAMFEEWLERMCANSCTSFLRRSTSEHGRVVYLRCNRAGNYESTGKDQRARTSKKETKYCTAHMTVFLDENGRVKAKGCFGHIGHDLEPALLRLTPPQEDYLRQLLNDFSFDVIIKKLRESHDGRYSKLHFVTKKDLWNLSRKNMKRPGWTEDQVIDLPETDVENFRFPHMTTSQKQPDLHDGVERKGVSQIDEKTICYAIVAIKSNSSKETLSQFLKNNGFDDVQFVSNLPKPDLVMSHAEAAVVTDPVAGVKKEPQSGSDDFSQPSDSNGGQGEETVFSEAISAADLMGHSEEMKPSSSRDVSTNGAAGEEAKPNATVKLKRVLGVPSSHRLGAQLPSSVSIAGESSSSFDSLSDAHFRKRFRISRRTFISLCTQIDHRQKNEKLAAMMGPTNVARSSTAMKVALVLDFLAGNTPGNVTTLFDAALEALAGWSATMICWPNDVERHLISACFFESTGLNDVVGCIAGSQIRAMGDVMGFTGKQLHRKIQSQVLNVGFVTDNRMRFRWVYAKHYGHMDDNTVFKRSMLYEQFRIGAKKGCLIGSNNYQSDFCVITPQSLCTDIERDAQQVEAITKAHNTVLTAIQHLKNQFPLLNRIIQLPTAKVAKVVVLCTALYNLAKGQGDPIFNDVDEKEPSNVSTRCDV